MRTSFANGPCERVSGSITLNGCDCDGVRAFPGEEPAAAAALAAEPTNIPSTDDSADSVTLNREVGLVRGHSHTTSARLRKLLLSFYIGGGFSL